VHCKSLYYNLVETSDPQTKTLAIPVNGNSYVIKLINLNTQFALSYLASYCLGYDVCIKIVERERGEMHLIIGLKYLQTIFSNL
jgi:hypothetical protein